MLHPPAPNSCFSSLLPKITPSPNCHRSGPLETDSVVEISDPEMYWGVILEMVVVMLEDGKRVNEAGQAEGKDEQ